MKISIALATFNGERFLPEQLESYLSQTRLPDEVVICDDGSSDRTITLIQNFNAPFSVRLEQNDTRLGVTRNFEKAVRLAQGDVIVFSDQDDVWLPHKLAKIEQALTLNSDQGGIFMNAAVVDEQLAPVGYTLWNFVGFTPHLQRQVEQGHANRVFLKKEYAWGVTLAFRANLRDLLLPFSEKAGHDTWTGLLVALHSGLALIPECLSYYRQHSANTVGAKGNPVSKEINQVLSKTKKSTRQQSFAQNAEYYRSVRRRLQQADGVVDREKVLEMLDQKIAFLDRRGAMPNARILRLPLCLMELLRLNYHRYSSGGFYSMGRDLLERD